MNGVLVVGGGLLLLAFVLYVAFGPGGQRRAALDQARRDKARIERAEIQAARHAAYEEEERARHAATAHLRAAPPTAWSPNYGVDDLPPVRPSSTTPVHETVPPQAASHDPMAAFRDSGDE